LKPLYTNRKVIVNLTQHNSSYCKSKGFLGLATYLTSYIANQTFIDAHQI